MNYRLPKILKNDVITYTLMVLQFLALMLMVNIFVKKGTDTEYKPLDDKQTATSNS